MIEVKVTKKAQAIQIFNEALAQRAAGKFDSNKAFRKNVMGRFVDEIQVSNASAASMYNQVKVLAEASDPDLKLGRDPKVPAEPKVKVPRAKKVKDAVAPAVGATSEAVEEAAAVDPVAEEADAV